MSQNKLIKFDFKGLVTLPGRLMRGATGSFSVARNVVFEAPGVIRKRHGLGQIDIGIPAPDGATWLGRSLVVRGDRQLEFLGGPEGDFPRFSMMSYLAGGGSNYDQSSSTWGDRLLSAGGLVNDSVCFIDLTSGTAISASPQDTNAVITSNMKRKTVFSSAGTHFYMTSGRGLRRWDGTYSGTTMSNLNTAGMPESVGLDLVGPTVLTSSGTGFLADGSQCAYRVTFCRMENGRVIAGAPTGKTIVRNSTGTSGYSAASAANVTARIMLPPGYTFDTSVFYRLYRTKTSTSTPSEEFYQIKEAYLSSSDVSNGYVDVTDKYLDELMAVTDSGAILNISPNSGETISIAGKTISGAAVADNQPPCAMDIENYAGHTFYGEYYQPAETTITLFSITASTGLTAGDTITVSYGIGLGTTVGGTSATSVTFTAVSGSPASTTEFKVYTAAATVTENIERTAQNLVRAINKQTSGNLKAFYISSPGGLPGKILLRLAKIDVTPYLGFSYSSDYDSGCPRDYISITMSNSRDAAFVPYIPTSSPVRSYAKYISNGVMYSKYQNPDSVPYPQALTFGTSGTVVLKQVAYRDSLFVFTTEGLYRLSGSTPNDFRVDIFDSTVRPICREAICSTNDAMYCWTTSGIMRITDSGAVAISTIIKPTVDNILYNVSSTSGGRKAAEDYRFFACADELNNRVHFYYPTQVQSSDSYGCEEWLTWDTRTEMWSSGGFYVNQARSGFNLASGLYRNYDGAGVFVGNPDVGIGGYAYYVRDNQLDSNYYDGYPGGSTYAIEASLECNVCMADPMEVVHWQEVQLGFEKSLNTNLGPPSALRISSFYNYNRPDAATTLTDNVNYTTPENIYVGRFIVPVNNRLSNGLVFNILISDDSSHYFAGIEYIGVLYSTTGSTKVTNK